MVPTHLQARGNMPKDRQRATASANGRVGNSRGKQTGLLLSLRWKCINVYEYVQVEGVEWHGMIVNEHGSSAGCSAGEFKWDKPVGGKPYAAVPLNLLLLSTSSLCMYVPLLAFIWWESNRQQAFKISRTSPMLT